MKLFICGPARHGKDTVAAVLRENYGLTHESSSHFCMRVFLREALEARYGLVYDSEED
jgi:ribose 1,5-bisphosphokinase PhnN